MRDDDALLEAQVRRFKALGHGARLRILRAVIQGAEAGTPAGEIQAQLDIPASTLSHHLSELAQAGLVKATRQGTTLRYGACFDVLRDLTAYLWEDCCQGGGTCEGPGGGCR